MQAGTAPQWYKKQYLTERISSLKINCYKFFCLSEWRLEKIKRIFFPANGRFQEMETYLCPIKDVW